MRNPLSTIQRTIRDSKRGVCDKRCCANGGNCDETGMCHNDHEADEYDRVTR